MSASLTPDHNEKDKPRYLVVQFLRVSLKTVFISLKIMEDVEVAQVARLLNKHELAMSSLFLPAMNGGGGREISNITCEEMFSSIFTNHEKRLYTL